MRLQSGGSVTVDILGSVEKFVGDIAAFALQIIGWAAAIIAAPFIYLYLGYQCARSNDSSETLLYIFTCSIVVSIWVLVLSRFLSARRWQLSGKELGDWGSNWREAQGGFAVSILKSFLYMFLGGFSSLVLQIAAVIVFGLTTGHTVYFSPLYMTDPTPFDITVFWTIMPLVAFSPVFVVVAHHWIRRRDCRATPSPTIPEHIVKAVEQGDSQEIIRIAERGQAEAALLGHALEQHWRKRAAMYREAARQVAYEQEAKRAAEEREAHIKNTRELETNLLSSIEAQIARMKEQGG